MQQLLYSRTTVNNVGKINYIYYDNGTLIFDLLFSTLNEISLGQY